MIKITKQQIRNIIKEAVARLEEDNVSAPQMTYGEKLKGLDKKDIAAATSEMKSMNPERLRSDLETYANIHPKLQSGQARDLFLSFADNPDALNSVFDSSQGEVQDKTNLD